MNEPTNNQRILDNHGNITQNGDIIENQVNNYFNADNIYLIYQNKYLEYFSNYYPSLKSMKIGKAYIIDFYFYFLSNFAKENDFEKVLNEYINSQKKELEKEDYLQKEILKIKKDIREEYYRLKVELEESLSNSYFNDNHVRRKLIYEINSNLQKKSDVIKNTLSFISNWDFEILFFINYLIKTDFKLFINSSNDELLFHAVGFLFYSNNKIKINQTVHFYDNEISIYENYNVDIVNEIFNFLIENKDKRNIDFIKHITTNFKNIYEYKQYFKIKKFLIRMKEIEQKIIFDEKDIDEIILNPIKLERINILIDEYERDKNQEIIIDNEVLLYLLGELPLVKSVVSILEE